MHSRLDLHEALVDYVGPEWTVYYHVPENIKLKYPCVLYNMDSDDTRYANDSAYMTHLRYQVTFIHKDVDSISIEDTLRAFEMCSFERHYVADNLQHYVFNIYV